MYLPLQHIQFRGEILYKLNDMSCSINFHVWVNFHTSFVKVKKCPLKKTKMIFWGFFFSTNRHKSLHKFWCLLKHKQNCFHLFISFVNFFFHLLLFILLLMVKCEEKPSWKHYNVLLTIPIHTFWINKFLWIFTYIAM